MTAQNSTNTSARRLPAAEPTLPTRLKIQINVISALMIRHLMARYGRGNLGFLWLVVEPIVLVVGVVTLWSFLYPKGKHGLPITGFVLASYMSLTLWRHLSSTIKLISSNMGLFYHRRITVLDVFIARALTELAGISAAAILVYAMMLSLGVVDFIGDPSLLLAGWMMMFLFGFGAGCLFAGLSEKYHVVEHVFQPVQYLLLPISGVFFMVDWLPKAAQAYILYIPLVHIYEMIRAGYFGSKAHAHYSTLYIVTWAAAQMALGLWALQSARRTASSR